MSTPPTTTTGTAGTTGTRSPQQAATSLFNDVKTTSSAIDHGDWLGAGLGATKVAMDVISISGDPLGAISSAGFGWLIGHIKFLREPFDKLLGDASAITGSAQGWMRASTQLTNSASAYRQAAQQETRSWTGTAADAYRAVGETQARNLDSLSEVSKAVSQALEGAGKLLAEVRKAVLDIINQACNKIIMIIIEALAASWGSFGASIAKGIAQSVQTAATSAAKSMQKIQKLVSSLQKIMQLVQNIVRLAQAVKQLLQTIGGKASGDTSAMQLSGTPIGYGGGIADGTAPRGTGDAVTPESLVSVPNYTYAGFTPGTPGAVNPPPLAPVPSYHYDGFTPNVQLAQANTGGGAAQQVSQNGWPVDPPRAARTVPGTTVRVVVANGPAGDVLMHVLTQVDQRVERLDPNATWGYAHREIRGGAELSNHASATAVDVNAPQHALGARGTFTQAQVDEIHRILNDDVNGVVRWGGDYRGRRDEMHFEIIGNEEQVRAAAERVRLINLTP